MPALLARLHALHACAACTPDFLHACTPLASQVSVSSNLETRAITPETHYILAPYPLCKPTALVKGAIDGCDGDVRREFWGNIVLTGAASKQLVAPLRAC